MLDHPGWDTELHTGTFIMRLSRLHVEHGKRSLTQGLCFGVLGQELNIKLDVE